MSSQQTKIVLRAPSGSLVGLMIVDVARGQEWLLLGRVTVCGQVNHLGNN